MIRISRTQTRGAAVLLGAFLAAGCRTAPAPASPVAGPSAAPLFEARITPSAAAGMESRTDPGLLQLMGMTLADMVDFAYKDQHPRVQFASPPSDQRYDIFLRAPADLRDQASARDVVRAAVSSLFGLRAERALVPMDVLFLESAGKPGPALKASSRTDDSGGGGGSGPEGGELSQENGEIAWLASSLEYYVKRPVLDRSGLPGRYDVRLRWDPRQEGSLERAVLEQLGLRLVPGKADVEVLRVTEGR